MPPRNYHTDGCKHLETKKRKKTSSEKSPSGRRILTRTHARTLSTVINELLLFAVYHHICCHGGFSTSQKQYGLSAHYAVASFSPRALPPYGHPGSMPIVSNKTLSDFFFFFFCDSVPLNTQSTSSAVINEGAITFPFYTMRCSLSHSE